MLRGWLAYGSVPIVGLITAPILARALGPEGRGQLAAMLQPLTVADAFAALGVPAAITFYIARGHSVNDIARVRNVMVLSSLAVVGTVLWFYSAAIAAMTNIDRFLILLLWTSIILGTVISNRRATWQGQRIYGPLDAERFSSAIIRLALIVLVAVFGIRSAYPYALAYVGAGLLAGICLSQLFVRLNESTMRTERVRPSAFVKYSVLASLGTISATLNNRLDQAILPAAVSASELGQYSVAVTVAEVPFILMIVMNRNLLAESSGGQERSVLTRTAILGFAGIGLTSLTLAIMSPWAIPLAFGDSFGPAVPVTQILLLATCFGAVFSCIGVVLSGRGHPGLGALGAVSATVMTVLLLFLAWPALDIHLAAWIAVGSQCVGAVVAVLVLISELRGRGNENSHCS
ncbi:integral membrane protein [Arthrobacter crystallopoietes BAB-32]|uniref:Integral membrane protein n=1 Tax=Arthrobacter crystallopoietes BAB-32 TaxID=1246476 RepID=N1V437_9MICC|nr:oligosaccharide flippase family protein [Arthrobacter crystallopoietes]EMY36120.1 integral membrane protein [Arthrobacter crystallopoietes BAB-32]